MIKSKHKASSATSLEAADVLITSQILEVDGAPTRLNSCAIPLHQGLLRKEGKLQGQIPESNALIQLAPDTVVSLGYKIPGYDTSNCF